MAEKRHTRLRTRILVWTFVPVAIILSAVAFTIYYAYQRVTEDLVVGRNQQLAHLSAAQLAADLSPYANTLNSIARMPDIYNGTSQKQAAAIQSVSIQLAAFDRGAVILDRLGNIVAAGPDAQPLIGQNWSDRDFFLQILHGASAAYSDIIPADPDHPAMLAIAVPITNPQGEFRGILAGLFGVGSNNSGAFYGSIVKLRLGQNGNTFLVDGAGRVIYHPEENLIGLDLHAVPDVAEVLKGKAGYLRTRSANGEDILATFAPVPGTPWGLVSEEDWASLLAASRGYGQFLLLLLALGILVPTFVVVRGVRRITDPVVRLTAAAREIAGGKYGEQISIQTGDELEVLGEQFNQMSRQLEQSYAQLEERVRARTKELATLNATAAVASRSLNLEEILRDALDKTLEVLEMESGAAYVLEGTRLVLVAQRALTEQFVRQATNRPLAGTVVEQAANAASPLLWLIQDFPETALKPVLRDDGIQQVLCVPLMAKGNLVGAFTIGTVNARPVAAETLSLLSAVGQQIGVAVENAMLYRQAEETAAAAERTRLARELHDAVTQTLFSASLIAEVLPDVWDASEDEGRRRLEELRQLTRGALAEMRTLLVELRPNALVQIPLQDLIRQLCESMVGRARLPIEVSIEGDRKLPPDVQVGFYRITQEALNNIVKHSKATQAVVTLRLQNVVRLSIADDGCGFDPALISPEHLGLKIMRERADAIGAKITITSEPGEGTRVSLTWLESKSEEYAYDHEDPSAKTASGTSKQPDPSDGRR